MWCSPATLDKTLEKEQCEKEPGEALLGGLCSSGAAFRLRSYLWCLPEQHCIITLPDLTRILPGPGLSVDLPHHFLPGWLPTPDLLCSSSLGLGTVPSLPCCQHQLLHPPLCSSSLSQLPDTLFRWISDRVLPLFWNCFLTLSNQGITNLSFHVFPCSPGEQEAFHRILP